MRIHVDWQQRLRPGRALVATVLLLSLLACNDPCSPTRQAYKAALKHEAELTETHWGNQERVTHFGMAMKLSLLNAIVNKALATDAGELFNTHKSVRIATQSIEMDARGRLSEASFQGEPSCPNCVKIAGVVTGAIDLDLPLLGKKSVPLRAPIQLVAPLNFARKEGGGVLQLDFKKLIEVGRSKLDLPTSSLPSPWNELVQTPVVTALLETVASRVGVIDLYQFAPPDIGIKGLEVLPSVLEVNAKTDTLFMGMSSNLPGLKAGTAGLSPLSVFPSSYNLAMAVHHGILLPTMASLLQSDTISRTYTTDGTADPNGPLHLVLNGFRLDDAGKGPKGGNPFALHFQLYNLPHSGVCYSLDATASGKLKLKAGKIDLAVETVKVNSSTLPSMLNGLANWAGAQFFSRGAQVFKSSLDPSLIGLPGADLQLDSPLLMVKETGLYTLVKASVKATGKAGGPAADTGAQEPADGAGGAAPVRTGGRPPASATPGRAKAPPPRE